MDKAPEHVSYAVGQVLYVVLRKEASVYPMQVVEVITKKTLEGELTTYMVRAGAEPVKTLAITEIDGEIFDSPEKVKQILIDRVTTSISGMVDQAVKKAREWYPTGHESSSNDPMLLIKKSTRPGEPPPLPQKAARKQQQPRPDVAALAAELQAEAEEAFVELPDGTKAKVKSVKLPPTMQG